MIFHVDVFSARAMRRMLYEVVSGLVVDQDNGWFAEIYLESIKKVLEQESLGDAARECVEFGLHSRFSHRLLAR